MLLGGRPALMGLEPFLYALMGSALMGSEPFSQKIEALFRVIPFPVFSGARAVAGRLSS